MCEIYETYKMEDGGELRIYYDMEPLDPRDYDNFSVMHCEHNHYSLGDKHQVDTAYCFSWEDVYDKIVDEEKPIAILPLYLYDHSGITISTTPFSCRWDSGQIGYIYTTEERLQQIGITTRDEDELIEMLRSDVQEYDMYLTGDVYAFEIVRPQQCGECGHTHEELVDSCGSFFGTNFKENGLFDTAGHRVSA